MNAVERLLAAIQSDLAPWSALRLSELRLWHGGEARLLMASLVAGLVVLIVVRTLTDPRLMSRGVVVPALLGSMPAARSRLLLRLPTLLFLVGLPLLLLAIADPYSALVTRQESLPGRRIGLVIDASVSMENPFTAATLNPRAATESTFVTTLAAAERFVQMRIKGDYRDLIGLIEFGNRAYVITPFTSDYQNILLSISLIGDPVEFGMFPDPGTTIARGIDESVELFKAFDFLDASGNLMVVFTDGEDMNAKTQDKTLDEILQGAVAAGIPVYFVRTNYARGEGHMIPDDLWRPAVERTGGRFYATGDERSLLSAIQDIDRVSAAQIEIQTYSSQRPEFGVFALLVAACWSVALGLKLGVPCFHKLL